MNILQIKRGNLADVPTGANRLKAGEMYFAEDVDAFIIGKSDSSFSVFVSGDTTSPVIVEEADTSSGDHESVLPDVIVMQGLTYVVKADGLIGGAVNISTLAGQYIDYDGNDSIVMYTPFSAFRFYSNGEKWLII